MPNQPTAKKLLKTKRKTAATMPVVVLVCEVAPARIAIDICFSISWIRAIESSMLECSLTAWPAAPNNMSFLRPNFSMVKIAMKEARKYSVPFSAARRRLRKPERPMLFSKIVAA